MNKYILKKGVFLRQIGLQPLCEWTLRDNDKLAEDYLKNDPTLIRYFSSAPSTGAEIVPPPVIAKEEEVEIIEPKEEEIPVEKIPVIKRKPNKRAKIKK